MAELRSVQTSPPRRYLDGMKAICEHLEGLGFVRPSARRVRSWVKAGMPARRLHGRWIAYGDELDRWWAAQIGS